MPQTKFQEIVYAIIPQRHRLKKIVSPQSLHISTSCGDL